MQEGTPPVPAAQSSWLDRLCGLLVLMKHLLVEWYKLVGAHGSNRKELKKMTVASTCTVQTLSEIK